MKQLHHHSGHGHSKIIFYFYQIAELLMLDSCLEVFRKDYLSVSWVVAFYNFHIQVADSSVGCPFPGLTAVTKELFRSLQVFAAMAWIFVLFVFRLLLCLITRKSRPSTAPYIASIVEILLLGYERLGHTSLQLLHCVPLSINGVTKWVLFLDGNITCWVHWWQFALIAYNIIFVIPFLIVLLIGTFKLRNQKISTCQFVAACFVPLPFLFYWSCLYLSSRRENIENEENHIEEGTHGNNKTRIANALLEVLQGPFRPPENQSRGAWYWESILIGRRLVLLCFYSFISTLMLRSLCMTVFCIVTLFHNASVKPYKDAKVNVFALLLLGMHVVLATINLCKSVLITVGITPEGPMKSQIHALQIFEVIVVSALPCMLGLLIVCVVVSQAIKLISVVYFYEKYTKMNNASNFDDADC